MIPIETQLTRKRLARMLAYITAGVAAAEIELKEPLAPDWQDRAWHELETARLMITQLQMLIQASDSSGLG